MQREQLCAGAGIGQMAGQMSNPIGTMTCHATQLADTAANQAGRTLALVSNRVLTAIGTVVSAAALIRIAAMVRVKTFHLAVDVVEEAISGIMAGVGDEAITFPVELFTGPLSETAVLN